MKATQTSQNESVLNAKYYVFLMLLSILRPFIILSVRPFVHSPFTLSFFDTLSAHVRILNFFCWEPYFIFLQVTPFSLYFSTLSKGSCDFLSVSSLSSVYLIQLRLLPCMSNPRTVCNSLSMASLLWLNKSGYNAFFFCAPI